MSRKASTSALKESDLPLYKQIGLCFDDDDQYVKERIISTELSSSALNAREAVLRFIQSTEETAVGIPHLQPSESSEPPSLPQNAKKPKRRLNEAHDSAVEESFTSDSSITSDETEEESPVEAVRALFKSHSPVT